MARPRGRAVLERGHSPSAAQNYRSYRPTTPRYDKFSRYFSVDWQELLSYYEYVTDFRAKRLAIASLLLMAMLWGSTFVVTKDAMGRLPALDLLSVRYGIALVVLALFSWRSLRMSSRTLLQGVIMGVFFAIGQISQTVGLGMTHASVSGFLTGTYVVFTPVLAAVFFRTRLGRRVWYAIGFAIVGLGVLSINPAQGASLGLGEFLTLIGAISFAVHIHATARYVTPRNAMSLTLSQTGFVVVVCTIFALPDGLVLPSTTADWLVMGYLAVIAGAATLFLQNWAQAYVAPTKAAVIMCSEPMWAAFFAVSIGGEAITWQMVLGGLSIVTAMYLVVANPMKLRLPRIDVLRRVIPFSARPQARPLAPVQTELAALD